MFDGFDRKDPRYWKLGLFYANPDDSSLFVPKRWGIGWTINFAHKQATLVMGVLLLFPVVLLLLSLLFGGR